MSMDKAILSGKEKRKSYRGSKRVDHTCRNHGSCPWCERNRTFAFEKAKRIADEKFEEYIMEG